MAKTELTRAKMAADLTSNRRWPAYAHCNTLASDDTPTGAMPLLRPTIKGQKMVNSSTAGRPCPFHKIVGIILPLNSPWNYPVQIALKQVYYEEWSRSPAQVGCMKQVLRAGALGRPRGMGWRGRREGRSGWGAHVNPWLIHVNLWQKPLQYCKVISLQLIEINGKKLKIKKKKKKLPSP